MDEQEQAAFGDAGARMAELAAEGRLAAAARAFAGWPFNDEEIAMAEDAGYFEAAGRYVPNLLNLLQQWGEHEGPTPDDPAFLSAISAPLLVLHGADTKRFLAAHRRTWPTTSPMHGGARSRRRAHRPLDPSCGPR